MKKTAQWGRWLAVASVSLPAIGTAYAADPSPPPGDELTPVTVTAAKLRSYGTFTPTGSRLGLDARDTPGTLDVIDSDEMLGRGFTSVEESAASLPGVTSGGSPGNPAQLSLRGFTGNQITMLRNGLYIGPANMTNRPQNVFNLDSVEILKGPASVLYGQGAVGGVINVVTKGPELGRNEGNFLASAGNYGTTSLGIGGTVTLSDRVALRADVSRTGSSGYVKDSPTDSFNATLTLLVKPIDTLELQFTVDYLKDNPSSYFGTPLVPLSSTTNRLTGVIDSSSGFTIDKRMRYVNYNVDDYRIDSEQYWPQVLLKWTPNEQLTVENFAYYFHADRKWQNAETYQYNPATGRVDRDRFFVFHNQKLYGDQASVSYKTSIAGRPSTLVAGIDFSRLDFVRDRGFPDGDSVDPFNPSRGLFGPLLQPGERVVRSSPTDWNSRAVFFENVVDLTPSVKLVTGGRHDRLDLERKNFNTAGTLLTATSFERVYSSNTWRAGLVFRASDNLSPYASFTTGRDPAGSNNIFLVNAAEGQNALSKSRQVEIGLKGNTPDKRADFTLALYDVERRNLLVQTGIETLRNGAQKSKGLEATGNLALTPQWTVSANGAYTDAKFDNFGADSGNRPSNIPKVTVNAWTSYRNVGGTSLEIGGGVRYVGGRYTDTANTLKLESYTLLDAYASYPLTPALLLQARVRNITDRAYAQWGDIFYPAQLMLGQPRTVQLALIGSF
jgi:iron complex outermembrane receptor protein